MRSSIVVGVDGSPAATRAARVAASFARRLDYRLVLAHVAGDPPVFPYGAARARELQRRRALEHATSPIAAVAKTIGEPAAKKAVVVSDVASGLAYIADNEGAALLAIGSGRDKRWGRTRHSRWRRLSRPSVAARWSSFQRPQRRVLRSPFSPRWALL